MHGEYEGCSPLLGAVFSDLRQLRYFVLLALCRRAFRRDEVYWIPGQFHHARLAPGLGRN